MKTMQQMVDQLNRALQLNPEAINALVNHRVLVNKAMVNAEDCSLTVLEDEGQFMMGLVGVLNGFRDQGDPVIAAAYDESDMSKVVRFILLEKVPASEDGERSVE